MCFTADAQNVPNALCQVFSNQWFCSSDILSCLFIAVQYESSLHHQFNLLNLLWFRPECLGRQR